MGRVQQPVQDRRRQGLVPGQPPASSSVQSRTGLFVVITIDPRP
jgi:hypothetical protein